MQKIPAIVVDDEKQARDGLKVLLERDQEIELLSFCKNGMEAIEQITRQQPKLLFLDIQMPEINGFEVLSSLPPDLLPAVIFATAYDKYALQAFEVHAIDYLLKPFTDKRFFQALEHAKNQIRGTQELEMKARLLTLLTDYQNDQQMETASLVYEGRDRIVQERLVIKSSGRIHFVPIQRIQHIASSDYFITVFVDQKEYMVRESLKSLLERLPPSRFFRIHRSHAVNVDMIQTVKPYANGDFHVTLRGGTNLRGSRKYRKELFGRFGLG